jgi:ethanolamine ammonia-lyase small subunit
MAEPPPRSGLAERLRTITPARVGLGRIHSALPTRAALDFDLAHALARDAVHAELPVDFAATLDVVADGLSASGVAAHAPAIVALLRQRLDWRIAPLIVARQARVALGDEIGAILGVSAVVMLIGERPGLSAPDSLGAYITWAPRIGRLDSERNCVSNIRPPHGLSYAAAADQIEAILDAARRAKVTGVRLKLSATRPLPAIERP